MSTHVVYLKALELSRDRAIYGEPDYESNSYHDPALPFSVFTCSNDEVCCFTGLFGQFNETSKGTKRVSQRVEDYVRNRLPYSLLGKHLGALSTKFYAAALIATASEEPYSHIAEIYLRAAWASLLPEGSSIKEYEEEPFYREQVIRCLELALSNPFQPGSWYYHPLYAAVIAVQYSRLCNRAEFENWHDEMSLSLGPEAQRQIGPKLKQLVTYNPPFIPEEIQILDLGQTLRF